MIDQLEGEGFEFFIREENELVFKNKIFYKIYFFKQFDRLLVLMSTGLEEERDKIKKLIKTVQGLKEDYEISDKLVDEIERELKATEERLGFADEIEHVKYLLKKEITDRMEREKLTHSIVKDFYTYSEILSYEKVKGSSERYEKVERMITSICNTGLEEREGIHSQSIRFHTNRLVLRYLSNRYEIDYAYGSGRYAFKWKKRLFYFESEDEIRDALLKIVYEIEKSIRLKLVYRDLGGGFMMVGKLERILDDYKHVCETLIEDVGYIELENHLSFLHFKGKRLCTVENDGDGKRLITIGRYSFKVEKEKGTIVEKKVV